MFSPYDFEINDNMILSYFKDEWNDNTNLNDQTKFRLIEISKIETQKSTKKLNQEINQKNHAVKKSIRYVAAFNYIDKTLIILGATSGRVCIFSSVSVAAAPVGIQEQFSL